MFEGEAMSKLSPHALWYGKANSYRFSPVETVIARAVLHLPRGEGDIFLRVIGVALQASDYPVRFKKLADLHAILDVLHMEHLQRFDIKPFVEKLMSMSDATALHAGREIKCEVIAVKNAAASISGMYHHMYCY